MSIFSWGTKQTAYFNMMCNRCGRKFCSYVLPIPKDGEKYPFCNSTKTKAVKDS